jgi:hypothetical protein
VTAFGGVSGVIVGYDPGGLDANGVATLTVVEGKVAGVQTATLPCAQLAIDLVEQANPVAIGIDTLTCWGTGPGGWRPADRWLRGKYPGVRNSVMPPNGLAGSMSLSGMALLLTVRSARPALFVTETHPKVLVYQLTGERCDFVRRRQFMDDLLTRLLGTEVLVRNEHEWDAVLSALAALEGVTGRWHRNLHDLPTQPGERIVAPAGATHYCWPA